MAVIISTIFFLGDFFKLRTPKVIPAMPNGIPQKIPEKKKTASRPSVSNIKSFIQRHCGKYQDAIVIYGKIARKPRTKHPIPSHNDDALTLSELGIGISIF
jgi:hypothetical protein